MGDTTQPVDLYFDDWPQEHLVDPTPSEVSSAELFLDDWPQEHLVLGRPEGLKSLNMARTPDALPRVTTSLLGSPGQQLLNMNIQKRNFRAPVAIARFNFRKPEPMARVAHSVSRMFRRVR